MIELKDMKLYNDDCLNILEKLKSENIQVDSIIVDLPYFRVVKDEFDNQWNNKEEYLNWVFTVFIIASYLIKKDGETKTKLRIIEKVVVIITEKIIIIIATI